MRETALGRFRSPQTTIGRFLSPSGSVGQGTDPVQKRMHRQQAGKLGVRAFDGGGNGRLTGFWSTRTIPPQYCNDRLGWVQSNIVADTSGRIRG